MENINHRVCYALRKMQEEYKILKSENIVIISNYENIDNFGGIKTIYTPTNTKTTIGIIGYSDAIESHYNAIRLFEEAFDASYWLKEGE